VSPIDCEEKCSLPERPGRGIKTITTEISSFEADLYDDDLLNNLLNIV
jgi:hypothetical protein